MGIVERLLGWAKDLRLGYRIGADEDLIKAADLIERLRGYVEHGRRGDGEACSAAWVKGAECDCGLSALLKEIEGD